MKILYIANARIPTEKAHGIQIMKMCEAFAGMGADLELIIPGRRNWIKDSPFDYYGAKKSFNITKLPCLDLIILDKLIGHLGLWVESATFFGSLFFYTLFKKADIIYGRDKYSLPLVLFKRNFILETHTFPKNYGLYASFFKRAKMIVSITRGLKDLFAEKGISPEKILVAPDGVDLEQFDIRETGDDCRKKLGLPLDKKIVLYAGHLYGWKGTQVLADASQYLPEDAEIYFVGGTSEDVRKFKIQNSRYSIHAIGQRPHSEIPYWLAAADVLVLPNSGKEDISKYWTSPMKMFEYMASKRPIVASDLPSIREILNEENAVLVEPDNPEKLAEGINIVLQNPQLSDRISTKAAFDVQEYTWSKRAKNIWQRLF